MTQSRGPEVGFVALASRLLQTRWLARAPIWLFRARLGFLVGSRLLLLEHVGRNSGTRRYVVLEVVDRPAPGKYTVASGFGERAQWFRNVRANPSVRVSVAGHGPRAATARILEPAAAHAALRAYRHDHPRAWHALRPVFEATLGAEILEDGTTLPLICLDATNER